jgi:hypothetical protein
VALLGVDVAERGLRCEGAEVKTTNASSLPWFISRCLTLIGMNTPLPAGAVCSTPSRRATISPRTTYKNSSE